MRLLFNQGKMHRVCAIAILAIALAPLMRGQGQSVGELNAHCAAGVETRFGRSVKSTDYAVVAALQQQRQANQSKIVIGMSREQVLQLLGPPDHAGAMWPDSAEAGCIWSYDTVSESDKDSPPQYRSLDVYMNEKQLVSASQVKQRLSLNPQTASGDRK